MHPDQVVTHRPSAILALVLQALNHWPDGVDEWRAVDYGHVDGSGYADVVIERFVDGAWRPAANASIEPDGRVEQVRDIADRELLRWLDPSVEVVE